MGRRPERRFGDGVKSSSGLIPVNVVCGGDYGDYLGWSLVIFAAWGVSKWGWARCMDD
jgi:hypothetical protein